MRIWNLLAVSLLISPFAGGADKLPGGLDTNFNPVTYSSDVFWTIALQPDGKVVVGGREGTSAGAIYGCITRLNTNGLMDGTFQSGPRGTCTDNTTPQIYSISLQTNGSMILGGAFTYIDSASRLRLARLDHSGTLDSTFSPVASGTVYATLLQPDGKIIIGGLFANFKGSGKSNLARINPDGSLDASFNSQGAGPNNKVLSMALAGDGKIVIGGDFTAVNGQTRSHVARLLSDGSVDSGFDAGTGPDDTVEGVAIANDGKVFIGGWFLNVSATPRSRIARLDTNGIVDPTFDPGTGANSRVYAFAFQADKILAAGKFTQYNGTNRSRIVRLNQNGSIDPVFDPQAGSGMGSSDEIRAVAVQTDGSILVAGKFNTFDGQPRNGIARLYSDSVTNLVSVPPTLGYSQTQGGIEFNWTGRFILQSTTNPIGSFQDIADATNPPVVIPNRFPVEFFRLRSY